MAEIVKIEDVEDLYSRACTVFFAEIKKIPSGSIVVALPGGRSIKPFLLSLVARAEELPLDYWNRLEFFMVDERVVPITDSESNFNLISNTLHQLVEELILRDRQLHAFTFEEGKIAEAVTSYSDELGKFGGKFHITCLGVGEDAHVAALFPDHNSIKSEARHFLLIEDSPKPPAQRMTSSATLIARSDVSLGFFIGEGKQSAYEKFLDPSITIDNCPAKLINQAAMSYVFTNLS